MHKRYVYVCVGVGVSMAVCVRGQACTTLIKMLCHLGLLNSWDFLSLCFFSVSDIIRVNLQ